MLLKRLKYMPSLPIIRPNISRLILSENPIQRLFLSLNPCTPRPSIIHIHISVKSALPCPFRVANVTRLRRAAGFRTFPRNVIDQKNSNWASGVLSAPAKAPLEFSLCHSCSSSHPNSSVVDLAHRHCHPLNPLVQTPQPPRRTNASNPVGPICSQSLSYPCGVLSSFGPACSFWFAHLPGHP